MKKRIAKLLRCIADKLHTEPKDTQKPLTIEVKRDQVITYSVDFEALERTTSVYNWVAYFRSYNEAHRKLFEKVISDGHVKCEKINRVPDGVGKYRLTIMVAEKTI